MKEKLNFNSVTNMAADHVRHEKLKQEVADLKRNVFQESSAAENNFDKLLENLPEDIAEKNKLHLENLLYAIGRIRAYSLS